MGETLRKDINKYMVILNILSQSEELDALAEGEVQEFESIAIQMNKEDILCATLRKTEAEIRPRIREVAKSLSLNAKQRMQAEDNVKSAMVQVEGSAILGEENAQICTRNRELAKSQSQKARKRMQAEDNEKPGTAMQEVTDATDSVKTIGKVRSRIAEIAKFLSQNVNLTQAEGVVQPDGAMELSETLDEEEEVEIRARIREIAKSLSHKRKGMHGEGIVKPEAPMDSEVDATDKLTETLCDEEVEIRVRIREIAKSLSERTKQRMQVEENLNSGAAMEEITGGEVKVTDTLGAVAEVRSRIREITKSLAQKTMQRLQAEGTIKSDEAMPTSSEVIATDTFSESLGEEICPRVREIAKSVSEKVTQHIQGEGNVETVAAASKIESTNAEVQISPRIREIAKCLAQKARKQMQAEGIVKPNASIVTACEFIATDTLSETLDEEEEEGEISPRTTEIAKPLAQKEMQAEGNVIPNASIVPTFEVKATVTVRETLDEEAQTCSTIREIAPKARKQIQAEGSVKSNSSMVPALKVKATVIFAEALPEEELKMPPIVTETAKNQMQAESIVKPNASMVTACEAEAPDTLDEEEVGMCARITEIAKSLAPTATHQMQAEGIVNPIASMVPACEAADVLSNILGAEEAEMRLTITEIAKCLVQKTRKQAESAVKLKASLDTPCDVEGADTLSETLGEEEDVGICPRITEIAKSLAQKARKHIQAEGIVEPKAPMVPALEVKASDTLSETLDEELKMGPIITEIDKFLAQNARKHIQAEGIVEPKAPMVPALEVKASDTLSETLDGEELKMGPIITETDKFLAQNAREQIQAEGNAKTAATACEVKAINTLNKTLGEEEGQITPGIREMAKSLARKARKQMQTKDNVKTVATASQDEFTDALSETLGEEEVQIRTRETSKSLAQDAREWMQAKGNVKTVATASQDEFTDALSETLDEEVQISPRIRETSKSLAQDAREWMQAKGNVKTVAIASQDEFTDALSETLGEEEVQIRTRETSKSLAQDAREWMQAKGNVKTVATASQDEFTDALSETLGEEVQISPRIREIAKSLAEDARQWMEAKGNVKTVATASEDESSDALTETLGEEEVQIRTRETSKSLAQDAREWMQAKGNVKTVAIASQDEFTDALSETLGEEEVQIRTRETSKSLAQDAREWMQAKGNVKTVAIASEVEATNTLSETSGGEEEVQISSGFREISKSLAQDARQWMQAEVNAESVASASKVEYTDALSETLAEEEAEISPRFRSLAQKASQQTQSESSLKPNVLMAPACEVQATDTLCQFLSEKEVEISTRSREFPKSLAQKSSEQIQTEGNMKPIATASKVKYIDSLSETLDEDELQISPRFGEIVKSFAQEARQWLQAEGNMKPIAAVCEVDTTDTLSETLYEEQDVGICTKITDIAKSLAPRANNKMPNDLMAPACEVEVTDTLSEILGGEEKEEAHIIPTFEEIVKSFAQEARQWLQAEGNMKPVTTACEVEDTNTLRETLGEEVKIYPSIREIAKPLAQKARQQMQAEGNVKTSATVSKDEWNDAREWMQAQGNVKTVATTSKIEFTDAVSKALGEEEEVQISPRFGEMVESLDQEARQWMQTEGNMKHVATASNVEYINTLTETLGEGVQISPRFREIAQDARQQIQTEGIMKPATNTFKAEATDALDDTLSEEAQIGEIAKSLATQQIQTENNAIVKADSAMQATACEVDATERVNEPDCEIRPKIREIVKSLAQKETQRMQAESNVSTATAYHFDTTDPLNEAFSEVEAEFSLRIRAIAKSLAQKVAQRMQAEANAKADATGYQLDGTDMPNEAESDIRPTITEIAKSLAQNATQPMQAEYKLDTGHTASSESQDATNPAKELDEMTSTIIQRDDAPKRSNNTDNNFKYSSFDYFEGEPDLKLATNQIK